MDNTELEKAADVVGGNDPERLITLAIHTYDQAVVLKSQLQQAGVEAVLHNVNLQQPAVSSGVRVRIHERDLPLALKVVEGVVRVTPRRAKLPTVLVPVDFSGYSLTGCRVAFEYAVATGARVLIMHAYMSERKHFFLPFASDRYDDGQEQDEATVKAKAQVALNALERTVRAEIAAGRMPQVPFVCKLCEGLAEERILEQASRTKASLIVMGTNGANHDDNHTTLGSVTAEVIDAGKFPVITVPRNISIDNFANISNVVFLSNLAPQDVLAFDAFTRMSLNVAMRVTLIPVVDSKKMSASLIQKSTEQLLDYCRAHYPNCDFTVVDMQFGGDLQEFHDYVAAQHVQLIAVPEKKRNILASLFNPGLAHRILYNSDIPMLVVPVK